MGFAIDFIMICETFLNDANMNMFQIPGHNVVCNNRLHGKVEELLYTFGIILILH